MLDQLGLTSEKPPKSFRTQRPTTRTKSLTVPNVRSDYSALTDAWQMAATQFLERCHVVLFSEVGQLARSYLDKRGVVLDVLQSEYIGFNPGIYRSTWGETSIFIPKSIIIPWYVDFTLWGLRYRPPMGGYKWVTGSVGKMLYGAMNITPLSNVVLVESELCRLVILSQCKALIDAHKIVPVAIGGTTGARALRWITRLAIAQKVLVALDNDQPGHEASEWWLKRLPNAQRLTPTEKDPGDMYQANVSLIQWLLNAVERTGNA